MNEEELTKFKVDFSQRKPDFEQLKTICLGLITNSLNQNRIGCLSIESRVKSEESSLEKAKSKKYANPINEITDFVALRVIVFLDRDIDTAANALKSLFQIDTENSVDKRLPEKVDTVGYRSLHLVCRLGDERAHLDEYRIFSQFPFEIQIRTALQHAWAEIEHKRRYKGSATLPNELQHRLMALSGTLELVDREFSSIVTEAEQYSLSLQDKTLTDKDQDTLSEIAIAAVYDGLVSTGDLGENFQETFKLKNEGVLTILLNELMGFGIYSVGELKELAENADVSGIDHAGRQSKSKLTVASFFRTAMMIKDIDKYLDKAHQGGFDRIDLEKFTFLEKALKRPDLDRLFEKHGISVIPF